jgi:peptide/nickel transport system permease protein
VSTPVAVLGVLVLGVLFVPVLSGIDPQAVSLFETNAAPSSAHWWGTDSLGRDVLVRTAAGGRLSLGVGLGAMAIATVLGAGLGGAAALGKPWLDRLIGRFVDLVLALPSIPLLIVLQSIVPRGVFTLVAVLGVSRCGEIARLSRAQCQKTCGTTSSWRRRPPAARGCTSFAATCCRIYRAWRRWPRVWRLPER